jgi:hypothetical protein
MEMSGEEVQAHSFTQEKENITRGNQKWTIKLVQLCGQNLLKLDEKTLM